MEVKYHSILSSLRTAFREPPPTLTVGVGSLSPAMSHDENTKKLKNISLFKSKML
jgi:hypothetical protein